MSASWLKVVFIGDQGVGKTSIIKYFCEGKFTSSYTPTVGVDYGYQLVEFENGSKVDVTFWDFAGGDEYYEVRRHLYQDSSVICIVCDVHCKLSVDHLNQWLQEAREHIPESSHIAVMANKVDLGSLATLTTGVIKTYSLRVYRVSAKTGEGIRESLLEIIATSHRKVTECNNTGGET